MEIACQGKQNGQFLLPFPLLLSPDRCLLTREGFVATFHSSVQRSFFASALLSLFISSFHHVKEAKKEAVLREDWETLTT